MTKGAGLNPKVISDMYRQAFGTSCLTSHFNFLGRLGYKIWQGDSPSRQSLRLEYRALNDKRFAIGTASLPCWARAVRAASVGSFPGCPTEKASLASVVMFLPIETATVASRRPARVHLSRNIAVDHVQGSLREWYVALGVCQRMLCTWPLDPLPCKNLVLPPSSTALNMFET